MKPLVKGPNVRVTNIRAATCVNARLLPAPTHECETCDGVPGYPAPVRITAIVNQKGGVGKTATAVNVGGALAELGYRVLLIDLDPQGHLTDALKISVDWDGDGSLAAAMTGEWRGRVADLIVPHSRTESGQLDVIPTHPGMFTVARELDRLRAREERLSRVIAEVGGYDHVLIDCPPALDILTDNALVAADGALVPVQAEDSSLHALRLLLAQIEAIEIELRDTRLTLHGLVISMLDRGRGGRARSTIGRTVIAALEELPVPILATVPRSVVISEAWRLGKTVAQYAPTSEHAQAYRTIAKVLGS